MLVQNNAIIFIQAGIGGEILDKEIYEILLKLDGKIDNMGRDISTLKGDVSILKRDVSTLKGDVSTLKGDVSTLKADMSLVKDDIKFLKTSQQEDHQILKNLEHNSNVNKAEHDKMMNDIAFIKGDLASLRKDLSTVEIVTANNYADIAKLKAVK
jgi:SMC interacting uncharacterized protein involved in chromosome segregation